MEDGVESKPIWVFLPSGTDELVGCQSFEGLETLGEVVGHQEGPEVFLQMLVSFVIELLDGGFFQSAVHAFDLAVRPAMVDLGETVFDTIGHADSVEDVREGISHLTLGLNT